MVNRGTNHEAAGYRSPGAGGDMLAADN